MIGPIAPSASFITLIDYGVVPTQPGVRLMAADGTTVTGRSTTGITNLGGNTYAKTMTAPASQGFYIPVWDDNNGTARYPDDSVMVSTILGDILTAASTTGSSSGGGSPITGDANGTLQGLTFMIKRNDTLPYIRRQFVDTNGNAVAIDPADTVMFTMRSSTDVAMAGTAKVHAAATIIDASSGIVEYRWSVGDTDTTTWSETSLLGNITETKYAAEFEWTRASDSRIETFPQSGYIAVSIPPDLDPGVTP